ncbi:MAG: tryptophan synthase subunit alpha [Campylobacteraceae bacterium]
MKQLVAYITAGFPDINFCEDAALSLKENGVDILELGVPFSDPVADGPVIELANLKALQNGFKMEHLFEISKRVGSKIDTFWMGYFNPFYHKGMDYFAAQAIKNSVCGFIIPDLPHEEAKSYKNLLENMGLELIDFIAPTHSQDRIKKIATNSRRFIYLVAYAGITGSGKDEDLSKIVNEIRLYSETPIYIGFGVNEKTAKEKAKNVDGVIVGSAFVNVLLDDSLTAKAKIAKISTLARTIKGLINE